MASMTRRALVGLFCCVACTATPRVAPPVVPLPTEVGEPVMLRETTPGGALRVEPDTGVASEPGTWKVIHAVGPLGIAAGGGIRVELPDPWHSGPRNSAIRLQATEPASPYYVSARASRDDVELRTIVEHQEKRRLSKKSRPSLDGRAQRFVYVVRVVVEAGALREGDILTVVYGDTSGGGAGYRASPVTTGPMPILMAVDADGSNRFRLHPARPTLRVLPGKPAEMQFHAPSIAGKGERLRLLVSLVDREGNPTDTAATVRLRTRAGGADLPASVAIPIREQRLHERIEERGRAHLRPGRLDEGLWLFHHRGVR
jgi:hypothetical protein